MVACVGEESVRSLALRPRASDGALVAIRVLAAVIPLGVVHARVGTAAVTVLAAEVGVASSRLLLGDAVLDGELRHAESAASHAVGQDVPLPTALHARVVGDGTHVVLLGPRT